MAKEFRCVVTKDSKAFNNDTIVVKAGTECIYLGEFYEYTKVSLIVDEKEYIVLIPTTNVKTLA